MFNSSRPNSNLKFHRSTNSVKVSNIPSRVSKREIVALFNALIGEVCGSQEIKDSASYALEIAFRHRDAATKALCMTGYTVSGTPLKVTPIIFHDENSGSRLQKDGRRNLYVLGLPFSLTKAELFNIFSCYGIVTHCVILATVDNSSRRRGFVVMSSHEEAKQAMASLTCTQLKGHTLDISWAVVQRSQGFLDGGDRSMALDSRPSSRVNFRRNLSVYSSGNSSNSSLDGNEPDFSSLVPSSTPTPVLLVSNLPSLLFSQVKDLHPLFLPFGPIKNLEVIEDSSVGSISVIVDYTTAATAKEAKDALTGQCYATFRVETCYLRSGPPISPSHSFKPAFHDFPISNAFASFDGLNDSDSYRCSLASSDLAGSYHNAKAWRSASNRLKSSLPDTHATHSMIHYRQQTVDSSRCNSANSRWSSDSASERQAVLGQINMNNYQQSH
ncbi:hypothetical protein AX17_003146 [Amanita inopinata Kibby_2008]|nr:hypothetical protein AX17_003146 [Amanita inopinata Kibby_2008]